MSIKESFFLVSQERASGFLEKWPTSGEARELPEKFGKLPGKSGKPPGNHWIAITVDFKMITYWVLLFSEGRLIRLTF